MLIALHHHPRYHGRFGCPGRYPCRRLSLEVHLAHPSSWWHWLSGLRWDRQWGGLVEVTVRLGLGCVAYVGISPKAERAERDGGAAEVPGSGRGVAGVLPPSGKPTDGEP